jgi:hypothetical protein
MHQFGQITLAYWWQSEFLALLSRRAKTLRNDISMIANEIKGGRKNAIRDSYRFAPWDHAITSALAKFNTAIGRLRSNGLSFPSPAAIIPFDSRRHNAAW